MREIQQKIEEKLSYDEYAWQLGQKISISYQKRAEGLHRVLYQCRHCGEEFMMESHDSQLSCNACGAAWEMNAYGKLIAVHGHQQIHIPDWYEWERTQTIQEIQADTMKKEYSVRVEALPNAKGFIALGSGTLKLDMEQFTLILADRTLYFPHKCRESVQTEYNYRGRGACIVLSDRDCCYYIYSDDLEFNPTKMQFAGEYLYHVR